jgi:hypothetical protein
MNVQLREARRLCIAILLGFVVGVALMGLRAKHSARETKDSLEFLNYTGQIIQNVNTLTAIRHGKSDLLVDETESDLSDYIYTLHERFPNRALSNEQSVRFLKRAARYRLEYPYKSDDTTRDRVVEEVLAKVSGGSRDEIPASVVTKRRPDTNDKATTN